MLYHNINGTMKQIPLSGKSAKDSKKSYWFALKSSKNHFFMLFTEDAINSLISL